MNCNDDYFRTELRELYSKLKKNLGDLEGDNVEDAYELGIIVGHEEQIRETIADVADIFVRFNDREET